MPDLVQPQNNSCAVEVTHKMHSLALAVMAQATGRGQSNRKPGVMF